jgi:hypothetical protein
MRISGLFHPKSMVLGIYFAGVMAFAGGCGEGGAPAGDAADGKKIESDQRAAREKAFGPGGNADGAKKASPAPGATKK